MPRAKRGFKARRRRNKILKLAKGYYGARGRIFTDAQEQVRSGWIDAFRNRREKKRDFRRLWIVRINAAARMHDMSYSVFINGLHATGIEIDRKVLADLAVREPEAFAAIAAQVRQAIDAAKTAA